MTHPALHILFSGYGWTRRQSDFFFFAVVTVDGLITERKMLVYGRARLARQQGPTTLSTRCHFDEEFASGPRRNCDATPLLRDGSLWDASYSTQPDIPCCALLRVDFSLAESFWLVMRFVQVRNGDVAGLRTVGLSITLRLPPGSGLAKLRSDALPRSSTCFLSCGGFLPSLVG